LAFTRGSHPFYEIVTLEPSLASPTYAQASNQDKKMPKVEIYSSGNCAYCVAAKNLIKSKGLDYVEIRVDTDPARREEMVARTHKRTVPQIFIDGNLVGGYDDLAAADRSGALAKLIGTGA
jgi:glutaredoxin 3